MPILQNLQNARHTFSSAIIVDEDSKKSNTAVQ